MLRDSFSLNIYYAQLFLNFKVDQQNVQNRVNYIAIFEFQCYFTHFVLKWEIWQNQKKNQKNEENPCGYQYFYPQPPSIETHGLTVYRKRIWIIFSLVSLDPLLLPRSSLTLQRTLIKIDSAFYLLKYNLKSHHWKYY